MPYRAFPSGDRLPTVRVTLLPASFCVRGCSSHRARSMKVGGSRHNAAPPSTPTVLASSVVSDVLAAADAPTPGFASIGDALAAVAAGELVVVMDDEDRENEGDLIGAADKVSEASMAFMVRHTSGVVCVALEESRADALCLPLMVDDAANKEKLRTAFCVTCDLAEGVTTGISAGERAATVRALASPASTPATFQRPGHVFPLRYRPGGVLRRAGHTEASVDLARLSGCAPVGVLCEVVNDDGSMARCPQLLAFGAAHNLKVVLISDLIRYRRAREPVVTRTADARLPTHHGLFRAVSYKSSVDGVEHVALVMGDVGTGDDVLVRVHSECLTGDIFASERCDCGPQLQAALGRVAAEGRGVVVYLRGQEGRGIGLGHKLRAYNLQDDGHDTVSANEALGFAADSREYGTGAAILADLGVKSLRLMTNNPAKYGGLRGHGLRVISRVPLITRITKDNARYIETKRVRMGHWAGAENVAAEEKR